MSEAGLIFNVSVLGTNHLRPLLVLWKPQGANDNLNHTDVTDLSEIRMVTGTVWDDVTLVNTGYIIDCVVRSEMHTVLACLQNCTLKATCLTHPVVYCTSLCGCNTPVLAHIPLGNCLGQWPFALFSSPILSESRIHLFGLTTVSEYFYYAAQAVECLESRRRPLNLDQLILLRKLCCIPQRVPGSPAFPDRTDCSVQGVGTTDQAIIRDVNLLSLAYLIMHDSF